MSSTRTRLRAGLLAACAAALLLVPAASARTPLETVHLQKIQLPQSVQNAGYPVYAHDGDHLLFFANVKADGHLNPDPARGKLHLWIVGTDGKGAHCLSCSTDEPLVGEAEQPGVVQPFPDGKRVFYGPYGDPRILQCTPTVLDCRTSKTYTIDLSPARPANSLIAPGGALTSPAADVGGAASPKLSPDGKTIAFSDVRTDSAESMILARLAFAGDHYTITDPRVLNPAGPTSATDPDTNAWSESAGLFEFKTFVDGGRAVTYVQVGGEASGNPDLWKLDLKTGKRMRLTASPEWDEDMSYSPDGRDMLVSIDSQGRHYVDWMGLVPFRGFLDASWIAAVAAEDVSSAKLRSCAPFAAALLPAAGDDGGRLIGQVLQPYDGGAIRDAGENNGWPSWSPDSTAVALSTQNLNTLLPARHLVVAHFDRKPTKPLNVVSSQPGAWAKAPAQYHGAIGATTTITLRGHASGTVQVHYGNPFFPGQGTVTMFAKYTNYSDDGRTFVNGTQTVELGDSKTELIDAITLHGEHRGSLRGDVRFDTTARPFTTSGKLTATYDGTTVTGPKSQAQLCAQIRKVLPHRVPLTVRARRAGGAIRVQVTAAQRGAGANERGVDRRPVRGATITVGTARATTGTDGTAILRGSRGSTVRVTAGDTFTTGTAHIR